LLTWILFALIGLVLLAVVAGQAGLLGGHAPGDLGVSNGRLKPPSRTPNSVSSQASLYAEHPQRDYADIAPLPLRGTSQESIQRLVRIVGELPGCSVVRSDAEYLYAQCRTPLLKFVDDLELWADPLTNVVQLRSASRLGRKDFGVNRERIDRLRALYMADPAD
jgi:uncharacterized protein (DUF1499 family)